MRGSALTKKQTPAQQRFQQRKIEQQEPETNAGSAFMRRPKTLTCTICGREFGTQSLEIHQRTCIQKYQAQIGNLPVEHTRNMPSVQQMQSKVDQERQYRQQGGGRPQTGDQPIKGSKGGKFDQYQQQPTVVQSLVQCRRCGRRFNPDRIMKHESVCIGPAPDISHIKEQLSEQNRRATKHLRPKQTGKWRQQHAEFVGAMRDMRKYEAEQKQGKSYGQPKRNNNNRGGGGYNQSSMAQSNSRGNGYSQSTMAQNSGRGGGGGYNPPQMAQRGVGYNQSAMQQPSPQVYGTKSNIVQNQRQQPSRMPAQKPQQQQQQQFQQAQSQYQQPQSSYQKPQQQYQQPQRPQSAQKPKQVQSYGRDLPQGMGGGNQQMAHSNVSTFSLFTNDGRPPDYSRFQRDNPYAKQ